MRRRAVLDGLPWVGQKCPAGYLEAGVAELWSVAEISEDFLKLSSH